MLIQAAPTLSSSCQVAENGDANRKGESLGAKNDMTDVAATVQVKEEGALSASSRPTLGSDPQSQADPNKPILLQQIQGLLSLAKPGCLVAFDIDDTVQTR